jgi:hypothetical protein
MAYFGKTFRKYQLEELREKGQTKVHTLKSEIEDFHRCCFLEGLHTRAGEKESHGNLGIFQTFYLE